MKKRTSLVSLLIGGRGTADRGVHDGHNVGSEQAFAPVRLPDTFAEGAWDKLPKTEGMFDFVSHSTSSFHFTKNYIALFFVC